MPNIFKKIVITLPWFLQLPSDRVARILKRAEAKIRREARVDAIADVGEQNPASIMALKAKLASSVFSAQIPTTKRIADGLVFLKSTRPTGLASEFRTPVSVFTGYGKDRLTEFEPELKTRHEAFQRADREKRAFLIENGQPAVRQTRRHGLVITAVLSAILAAEAMITGGVLKDVSPTPAHSVILGVASSAFILVPGILLGVTLGKELVQKKLWRKAIGLIALIGHLGLAGCVALTVAGIRRLALELDDLYDAMDAVIPTLLANENLTWILSDILGVALLLFSLGAAMLSFVEGMRIGYPYPHEGRVRGRAKTAEQAKTDCIDGCAEDLDDERADAGDQIKTVYASALDHAAKCTSLTCEADRANREICDAVEAADAGLKRMARIYEAEYNDVIQPHAKELRVIEPVFEMSEAVDAMLKLANDTSAEEATATKQLQGAELACDAAHVALDAEAYKARKRFDAIVAETCSSTVAASDPPMVTHQLHHA